MIPLGLWESERGERVCVWGGCHWLVGSIICWTGRPVTPPLERLLMKRKAAQWCSALTPPTLPVPPAGFLWLLLTTRTPHTPTPPHQLHPHCFPPAFLLSNSLPPHLIRMSAKCIKTLLITHSVHLCICCCLLFMQLLMPIFQLMNLQR